MLPPPGTCVVTCVPLPGSCPWFSVELPPRGARPQSGGSGSAEGSPLSWLACQKHRAGTCFCENSGRQRCRCGGSAKTGQVCRLNEFHFFHIQSIPYSKPTSTVSNTSPYLRGWIRPSDRDCLWPLENAPLVSWCLTRPLFV